MKHAAHKQLSGVKAHHNEDDVPYLLLFLSKAAVC